MARPVLAAPDAPDPRTDLLSDLITQITLLDLGMQQSPRPSDYELAYRVLAFAAALDPDDLELRHKMVAAAWGTTSEDMLVEASRKIIELDPHDSVAQLRVITSLISRQQTAEDRLDAYDRFLGRAGENLDPAVRSRLALDAALLARELGDEQGFVRRLSLSTSLDMTHKEAATLAASFHAERRDVPAEQFEMLVNLLYADPLDPNVHDTLARLLAQEGVYTQGRRFATDASIIRRRSGSGGIEVAERDLIFLWHAAGPQRVLDALNDELASQRSQVAVNLAVARAAEMPVLDMTAPEEVRLDPTLDRLRILAAASVGDTQSLEAALTDLSAGAEITVRRLVSAAQSTDPQAKVQAIQEISTLFNIIHFVRMLVGTNAEESAAAFQNFSSIAPEVRTAISGLVPWITLRLGRPDAAREQAVAIASPSGRTLLEAEIALFEGDESEAVRLYLEVARMAPITPIGCWAHAKLDQLGASDRLLTPDGERMREFAARVDPFIDKVSIDTLEFMAIRVEALKTTINATDRTTLRIRIQNVAPIPLGLGSARPISSRMLVQPKLDTETGHFRGDPQPLVLDLDRRLRLMPLETLEVEIDADSPYTQWLLDINAGATMRQRWRLLQGFRSAGEQGAMLPGPLCLSAETPRSVVRLAMPSATMPPAELARRLRHDPRDALVPTLFGIRALLLRDVTAPAIAADQATIPQDPDAESPATPGAPPDSAMTDPGELDDLVQAAIERYERSDAIGRAIMLAVLPHARMNSAMAPFEAAIRKSIADRLQAQQPVTELETVMMVFTRGVGAQDPLLTILANSASSRISAIASLLVERYTNQGFGYATVSSDLDTIAGPTIGFLRKRSEAQSRQQ